MLSRKVLPTVAAALVLVLAGSPPSLGEEAGPGPGFKPGRCPGGVLSLQQGVPVLQVAGSPEVLGRAYGTLLGEQIRCLSRNYLGRIVGRGRLRRLALEMAGPMEPHIPKRYLRELAARAASAGESREDALLTATFLDLYRFLSCSAFVVGGPASAGEPLLARNLDFPTFGVAHRYSLVVVFHPEAQRSFLSVTWPGLPGVVSGMNEAGLVLVMLEVADERRSLAGTPYQLLYRRVLEECDTVEEAERLIRSAPRTVANNVVLLDARGDSAVLEVTSAEVASRRPERGLLWATNHFRALRPPPPTPRRYGILGRELLRLRGRMGVPQAAELLTMVHQGPLTMQSMIFEPRSMRVHLALGRPPACFRPYVTLDARSLFERRPGGPQNGGP